MRICKMAEHILINPLELAFALGKMERAHSRENLTVQYKTGWFIIRVIYRTVKTDAVYLVKCFTTGKIIGILNRFLYIPQPLIQYFFRVDLCRTCQGRRSGIEIS